MKKNYFKLLLFSAMLIGISFSARSQCLTRPGLVSGPDTVVDTDWVEYEILDVCDAIQYGWIVNFGTSYEYTYYTSDPILEVYGIDLLYTTGLSYGTTWIMPIALIDDGVNIPYWRVGLTELEVEVVL